MVTTWENSFADWSDVTSRDDDIVEPDRLALFPKLFRWVTFVVSKVFQPKAIHLEVEVVPPADPGEFAHEGSVEPHRLFTIGFVGRAVGLNHEFPALPLIEFWNDAVRARRRPFSRSRWEEGVTPILFHFPIRLHVEIVGVKIEFTGRRIFSPGKPRLHAGRIISAVRLQAGLAEGGLLVGE